MDNGTAIHAGQLIPWGVWLARSTSCQNTAAVCTQTRSVSEVRANTDQTPPHIFHVHNSKEAERERQREREAERERQRGRKREGERERGREAERERGGERGGERERDRQRGRERERQRERGRERGGERERVILQ